MEETSQKIIDMETLQVTESSSSVAMEKDAFRICLNRLLNRGVNVKVVVTDRSPSITKIMRTEYPQICHQFDVWHVCKSKFVRNAQYKMLVQILLMYLSLIVYQYFLE